ncbi:HAUS augmin-like complex subunit 8 [Saccoglossus kowalevskii]|uniref:HAUS augmin-like complex subunit 8-like n=1 Tax=Saccoglossus kowalevskii TaxID=10224 RepID=A0ABM0MY04_SACKO|nr:PREDICTED: HAUS augmin-like complex subunit 8-like [Saccoglossus kowalevskii]
MDKVMEEREKDAMSEIYWIWNENEMLSLRKAELETELVDLHYKNKLDELLKVQREGLGPIVSGLDQLKKQHNTLAQAVDTTRHHVPTKGINIPVNERDYLVDMGKALNETEQLLGEIHMLTREHQPQVKECAKSIGALKDATLNEGVELYRLNEVMAAVSTLTTHETSLKIQHMDLKDPRAAELNQLDITKSVLEQ